MLVILLILKVKNLYYHRTHAKMLKLLNREFNMEDIFANADDIAMYIYSISELRYVRKKAQTILGHIWSQNLENIIFQIDPKFFFQKKLVYKDFSNSYKLISLIN